MGLGEETVIERMCSIPLMKGRHFCSPILVNHWQTSSVFSFPRDLASCRSMAWGEGAVTHLLLTPQPTVAKACVWCPLSLCNGTLHTSNIRTYILYIQNIILRYDTVCICIFFKCSESRKKKLIVGNCKERGTWRTKMIQTQTAACENWFSGRQNKGFKTKPG